VYISTVSGASATVTVKNSVISQNGAISTSYYGIRRTTTAGSVVNVTHNDVWDNGNTGTRNVLNVTLGNGCFAANPLYVNSASNLRITSNSPARFASDTAQDIGALHHAFDVREVTHAASAECSTEPLGCRDDGRLGTVLQRPDLGGRLGGPPFRSPSHQRVTDRDGVRVPVGLAKGHARRFERPAGRESAVVRAETRADLNRPAIA
jgi:hypothetical protein